MCLKKNVSMVKEKVNAVHKAKNVIDVNKAKDKVTKAVNDAKETVKIQTSRRRQAGLQDLVQTGNT